MANRRTRGKNMRAHDQDIKLNGSRLSDCLSTDSRSRTTNMPDAAQVQEAVVPSLTSSGFVASGTGPGSTEASSRLEDDARRLSDKSSSSNAEDMRVVVGSQLETWPIIPFTVVLRVMSLGRVVTRHKFNSRTKCSRYKCSRYKEKRVNTCNTKYMTIKSFLTTFHHPPDPVPQPPSFWMSAARWFIPTGSDCPNPAEGGAFL